MLSWLNQVNPHLADTSYVLGVSAFFVVLGVFQMVLSRVVHTDVARARVKTASINEVTELVNERRASRGEVVLPYWPTKGPGMSNFLSDLFKFAGYTLFAGAGFLWLNYVCTILF